MRAFAVPCVLAAAVVPAWACSDPTGPGAGSYCATRPDSAVVAFEDPALELAIYSELSVSTLLDLTCARVARVTDLNAAGRGIASLRGIGNLVNLRTLWIRANEITDIAPLAGLTGLTSLNLADNRIADLSPLSGLSELTFLAVNQNGLIANIEPLASLTNLTGTLWLAENAIADLSALSGLTGLTGINAWDNEITDIGGLAGLTGLMYVRLHINRVTDVTALRDLDRLEILTLDDNADLADIGPLLGNPALASGASVGLRGTDVSCDDVAALEALGASVLSDCP